ncbi:hypothetical protein PYR71_23150 [Rhizobium sp. MC63]|uniref:Uncharacterized protein n=1 Tax=Rhizobium mulingense TaxID=3031128 RepID=A0ACC6N2F4_9HYPH|nr:MULTISPECIES: hypothetical protein [unclassified Rhizobium]MDF0699348.1 hypothetical protein [Rhizobium sp. MC63]MEA3519665.1 hypothetical protein [Rhizobium sp. MJ31]MEB3045971.1 hypothetical protein [Rhizobium sp. MJ21]
MSRSRLQGQYEYGLERRLALASCNGGPVPFHCGHSPAAGSARLNVTAMRTQPTVSSMMADATISWPILLETADRSFIETE